MVLVDNNGTSEKVVNTDQGVMLVIKIVKREKNALLAMKIIDSSVANSLWIVASSNTRSTLSMPTQ